MTTDTVPVPNGSTTDAAQASPSRSAAGTPASSTHDLLTHPTPRPPGVSAQFEFVGGAGPGPCFEMGNPPQVRVLVEPFPGEVESTSEGFNDEGIATYGQPVDVCFDHMGQGPVSVKLTGPEGFEMSGVLPRLPATSEYHSNNEWSGFDWIPAIDPSWPQGSYVITARAGSVRRSHSLTLVPPHGPGLRVLGPSTDPGHNSVPPNSRAKLFLTGFTGSRTVKLAAYRTTDFGPRARFYSAAGVSIPPSGNTIVEIPTGPEEGRGGYESTFIVTARARGRSLFAPFSVAKELRLANLIVGRLPTS